MPKAVTPMQIKTPATNPYQRVKSLRRWGISRFAFATDPIIDKVSRLRTDSLESR